VLLRIDLRTAAAIAALWLASPDAAWTAAADPLLLSARAQGGWTAPDKELHFAGSLAISASLRVAGRGEGESLGAAVGVGALKELYDATLKPRRKGRGASWRDLIADVLGAAAGVALVKALDR